MNEKNGCKKNEIAQQKWEEKRQMRKRMIGEKERKKKKKERKKEKKKEHNHRTKMEWMKKMDAKRME